MERWRDAAYSCYSSGHKFCREVCPVTQVTRNENHSPTAFHANVVAMEQGLLDVADVAEDYVHCTQCGACELRCPNTLFTGDFYRYRTRTVEVVKAMRALMVQSDNEQPEWKRWIERLVDARSEPVLGEIPVEQEHVADWAAGLDLPVGGETVLFVDCEAAFYRTSYARAIAQLLKAGGVEFGLMREQWCCGGPAAEMGYVEKARSFAEHNVADWRAVGAKRIIAADPHDYIAFTEDYPSYFADEYEFEIVLAIDLVAELVRDGRLKLEQPGAADGHLPRPLPAEQTQGRARGAAGAAARGAGADVRRRRSRHPVVVLLGGRGRTRGREARADGRDQPPARGARRRARGRHARSAPARGPSGRCRRPGPIRGSRSWTCSRSIAEAAGIEVGGSTGAPAVAREGAR